MNDTLVFFFHWSGRVESESACSVECAALPVALIAPTRRHLSAKTALQRERERMNERWRTNKRRERLIRERKKREE